VVEYSVLFHEFLVKAMPSVVDLTSADAASLQCLLQTPTHVVL
jgi:hypothetical protein